MNKLSPPARNYSSSSLQGSSICSIVRITGVSKNTISKLLIDVEKACPAYREVNVRDLETARVEVDKSWSLTYAKQKNVVTAKAPCGLWTTCAHISPIASSLSAAATRRAWKPLKALLVPMPMVDLASCAILYAISWLCWLRGATMVEVVISVVFTPLLRCVGFRK